MDKAEIKKAIKRQKILPSELFDKFSFREDPVAKEMISDEADFEMEWRDQQANKEIEKEIEEDKLRENEKNGNELIPGGPPTPLTPEEKKKQDEANELVPDDVNEKGKSGNNDDLIPD